MPQPISEIVETVERRISNRDATGAISAIRQGRDPSRRELRELKKLGIKKDIEARLALIKSFPKRDYVRITGRQHSTLAAQAGRFGFNFDGKTIDLTILLRKFHDFLASERQKLRPVDPENPDEFSTFDSPELERWRRAKADIAEIERDRLVSSLVDMSIIMPHLAQFALRVRKVGESYERKYGRGAADMLNEALDDAGSIWKQSIARINDSLLDLDAAASSPSDPSASSPHSATHDGPPIANAAIEPIAAASASDLDPLEQAPGDETITLHAGDSLGDGPVHPTVHGSASADDAGIRGAGNPDSDRPL